MKLSQVVTRMGELEYKLNFVVITLPIESTFQVLLGRPWLYKVGVLEDQKFRIGAIRIPWEIPSYHKDSTTPLGYTTDDDDEPKIFDCWMVVNAFKTTTEAEFELQ